MPEQPVALVTGGNRGIGLAVCRHLVDEGWSVLLGARDPDEGERAAATLSGPGAVDVVTIDVTDEGQVEAACEHVERRYGSLRALVNNAGTALSGFDLDIVRKTLEVNVFGLAAVTDELAPLVERGGSVVMVSSGMGSLDAFGDEIREQFLDPALDREGLWALLNAFCKAVEKGIHQQLGWPSSAYRVSKAAVNALTRLYAAAYAEQRLHVNAVCPGWVRTRMGGQAASRDPAEGAQSVLWAVSLDEDGPTGGFFRDGNPLPW